MNMKTSMNSTLHTKIFSYKNLKIQRIPLLLALLSVGFWSCSSVSNDTELISDADLDMAAEIMGSFVGKVPYKEIKEIQVDEKLLESN